MADRFYGNDVEVREGRLIEPDGWGFGQRIRRDEVGFAPWRIPVNSLGPIESLAVDVVRTGRTMQWRGYSWWVRVKVIFKGDGEPDVESGGWMLL